ncbi:NAD-dependent epimerase/dehydratase family protein [Oceaniglobus ichthyenteri]|uniref:NAD-dependent epimerase/dehydratase family protein n=1 Tax=Oceaniglobus ichthyenteri TaxID=2136177 RepID=UPI000D396BD7|nr:NAD-dependent epimerase/dehydratase family protein [Oceaniglobus ichthyenteri]
MQVINSRHTKKCTVFLAARSRVARPVVDEWPKYADIGGNLLTVGRQAHPTIHTIWDMADPAPEWHFDQPPVIVCFAGITPRSGQNLDGNTDLALAAQRAADIWGARHVFHLSSAAVYGDCGPAPISEHPDPTPQGAYGTAKLAMERALIGSHTPHTVLRLGNVAGAGQPFDAATNPTQPKLDQFADGAGPSRSYIGPLSLARVLAHVCQAAHEGAVLPRLLNVAAPRPTAMADIFSALGRDWQWIKAPDAAIQMVHLDTTRLDALCRLAPETGLAQTLINEITQECARR